MTKIGEIFLMTKKKSGAILVKSLSVSNRFIIVLPPPPPAHTGFKLVTPTKSVGGMTLFPPVS
jgi:hypothetical protein